MEDIAGLEHAKDAVREPLGCDDSWETVLLYGPPGCGKTRLAKAAIAEHFDSHAFFFVPGADLIGCSDFNTAQANSAVLLRELFHCASRETRPAVIVLDSLDVICKHMHVKAELVRQLQTLLSEDNRSEDASLTDDEPGDCDCSSSKASRNSRSSSTYSGSNHCTCCLLSHQHQRYHQHNATSGLAPASAAPQQQHPSLLDEKCDGCGKFDGNGEESMLNHDSNNGQEEEVTSTACTGGAAVATEAATTARVRRVVVLAITNLPWEIDIPLLQHFENRVAVDLPVMSAREVIIGRALQTRGAKVDDVRAIAQAADGYSVTDLQTLVKHACRRRRNNETLTCEDFRVTMRQIKPTISKKIDAIYNTFSCRFGHSLPRPLDDDASDDVDVTSSTSSSGDRQQDGDDEDYPRYLSLYS